MKTLSQIKSELNAKSLEFAEKAKAATGDDAKMFFGISTGLWFASAYVGAYAKDGEWEMMPAPGGVALMNMIPQYRNVSVMWGKIETTDDMVRVGKLMTPNVLLTDEALAIGAPESKRSNKQDV